MTAPLEHREVAGLTRHRFGALVATAWCRRDRQGSRGWSWLYLCRCECGDVAYALAHDLKSGIRDRCSPGCEPASDYVLARHRAEHGVDPSLMNRLITQGERA